MLNAQLAGKRFEGHQSLAFSKKVKHQNNRQIRDCHLSIYVKKIAHFPCMTQELLKYNINCVEFLSDY